ncbi:hypothetical protein IX39_00090 [Chryseobacterium formosense]|uniref:Uncharacterized protein n=1 Tax=Chryseobacterium formosense TaxID=236814 RepID=A0A085Z3W8_9FLAO|nr:hypothetical protein [Chryseobacterium formosense]KFE99131.1 hypothetical protein IX39_00090 [Chryseobacterium formosense]
MGIIITEYTILVEEYGYKISAWFSFSYKNSVIYTEDLDLHLRTETQNKQVYYSEFILGCFRTQLQKH